MKKPPDKVLPNYRAVKQTLSNVVKHKHIQDVLLKTVLSAHKIVIHAMQFMKMYLIHEYDKNGKLTIIDHAFVSNIMKIICEESNNTNNKKQGRPPNSKTVALKYTLQKFYNEHYKETITTNEVLSYTHMNTILDYLTIDTITIYETNIKQHYVEYVERFINILFEQKQKVSNMTKDETNVFYSKLRKIKNTILDGNKDLPTELSEHIKFIIPQRPFKKDNMYYDIQCSPQDYLPCMIYMMKFIESKDESIKNVFPLRSDIIPKYIRIDTTTLVHLLITKKQGSKEEFLTEGNLIKRQSEIWKYFFHTEKSYFSSNNYIFNYMIETDGIACSILLVRKDVAGKRFKPTIKTEKEYYIDDVDNSILKNKNIVAIDPNKSDLIYCISKQNDEILHFRYTQDQKRKETKDKKYRNIRDELKKTTIINNKTIIEWETELSKFNRKTLQLDKYKAYCKKKNEVNSYLLSFYEQKIFRKLKWNTFMNRKRSEHKMINRFKEKFGSSSDTIIGFGDWEQKKQMKYKEPTKGIGMRNLFRKAGYQVYLVDEFRTSCRCSKCEGECVKFKECQNPRPWKKNETILRHGLLMCKTCKGLWNRDVNSSFNIFKIVENIIAGKERPVYLQRVSNTTSVLQKQILDEDEKPQL
jgi:hypothetical protein